MHVHPHELFQPQLPSSHPQTNNHGNWWTHVTVHSWVQRGRRRRNRRLPSKIFFGSQVQQGQHNRGSIVIISGEIFTIELRPGSGHRGAVLTRERLGVNSIDNNIMFSKDRQDGAAPYCVDAVKVGHRRNLVTLPGWTFCLIE